ncbi:MAG: bifunctional DNA-formamidopyrimidine glycosylase/DNA-(apurinic or apyrimidinic site) lyase [Deltaproteobacteria bacterium]|nr:bifunctional DNA-formamidopyrimidine glycosylase/DNA-(apurinic or apyrimidinic site) lyase [Deltaproteobacteria bacterium]
MPELPEVETIVCGLKDKLGDLEFSEVEVHLEKCLLGSKKSFITSLKGKKILHVERRGKNIVFHLNGGMAMVVHLRMTGKLRFLPAHTPPEKHTHVIFSFKGHPYQLRFVDQRQFGRLFVEKKEGGDRLGSLAVLGPEPLEVSAEEFIRRAREKRRAIKSLLLDQRFLAGVGNIYTDEALHRARLHPRRQAASLREKDILRLYHALQRILRGAIRAGGTSVRTYVDARGATGGFQKSLRVYGREGKNCGVCGRSIVRERVGGRSSFFCLRCQPEKGR